MPNLHRQRRSGQAFWEMTHQPGLEGKKAVTHKKRKTLSANLRHQEKYCLLEKYQSTFGWWPLWMWRTSWEQQTKTRPRRTLQPISRTIRIKNLNNNVLAESQLLTSSVMINFQWNGKKNVQQIVPSNILVVSHTWCQKGQNKVDQVYTQWSGLSYNLVMWQGLCMLF